MFVRQVTETYLFFNHPTNQAIALNVTRIRKPSNNSLDWASICEFSTWRSVSQFSDQMFGIEKYAQ